MRVTINMIYSKSVYNLSRQYDQFYRQNEIVSSGKRINRPSDDPTDMVKILGLRTLEKSIEQYKKNIDNGKTWLQYTESALDQSEQVFMDAKVLAEQMATGTYDERQREMLALQAGQMFEQMMQIGNTKVVDRYIFSGFKTSTQTFTRDNEYNIEFNGDNGCIKFAVSQSTEVAVNTTGQNAFLDDINVFDVLRDLRTALQNNDQHSVQEALPKIDAALNQIIKERSYVGTSIHQMESAEMMIEDFGFKTVELLSDTENADLIEAVTKLQESEIVFQATLKSTAMITSLSLVNYI